MTRARRLFGDAVFDTDRYLLERDGTSVAVRPQVFDVLSCLVEHRERVVPKTELLDSVWGDRFVGESAPTSRIKSARQHIGDDGAAPSMIRTVHGRGDRWVADISTDDLEPAAAPLPETNQHIRFWRTADGARLGYATIDDGPPLVRAAHWITHVDYDFESPIWRHWSTGCPGAGCWCATTSGDAARRNTIPMRCRWRASSTTSRRWSTICGWSGRSSDQIAPTVGVM